MWNDFIKEYLRKINDNVFEIEISARASGIIRDRVIQEKIRRVREKELLNESDLALVRTFSVKDFPKDFTYHILSEENCFAETINPFTPMLRYVQGDIEEFANLDVQCPHSLVDAEDLKIIYTPKRRTKHFSLNGLASNVYQLFNPSFVYQDKGIIVIEPFKDKINNPTLVNINPVDTFFDLSTSPLKISDDALFLVQKDHYQKIKEHLGNRPVLIFEEDQELMTDIALIYMGYLPQHSKNQSILVTEYGYDESGNIINDEDFIKMFKDLIEDICLKYLGTSYYHIPKVNIRRRAEYNNTILNVPGILHADTAYAELETQENIKSILITYYQYLEMIFKLLGVNRNLLNIFYLYVRKDILDKYDSGLDQNFYYTYAKFEGYIKEMLEGLGYPKIKEVTDNFKEKKLMKLENREYI